MHLPSNKKGITLVEVLVVIMIISMAFIGLMSLNSLSVQAMYINRNALIASQLAQEAIELVRNQRDQNWLNMASDSSTTWKDGIGDGQEYFAMDYSGRPDHINQADEDLALNDAKSRLVIDSDGYYASSTAPAAATTIFRRVIRASSAGDMIHVTVAVRYRERNRTQKYKLEADLYNWR